MKISIILATYNAEKHLERALASIFCQTYPNYELIVQDGASQDNTLEILKKYMPHGGWRSEKDTGIYEAWNKALERATGDWCLFLGADDCLIGENTLVRCYHHMKRLPKDILFVYGALAKGIAGQVQNLDNVPLVEAYRRFTGNLGIPFPATFVRLDLAKKCKFDDSYKIAGDFDFVARYLRSDNITRIPLVVSYMEQGGMSSSAATRPLLLEERGRVLREHILPKAQEVILGCIKHYMNADTSLECLS